MRDRDGILRGFANVCRHRGSLLLEGSGTARSIACPYHAWTYRLDGTLVAAPDMERSRGFDRGAHGLLPIRLESWQGVLFLNARRCGAAAPRASRRPAGAARLHRFDEMVCTWRHEIECPLQLEDAGRERRGELPHRHRPRPHRRCPEFVTAPTRGEWLTIQVLSQTSVAVLTDTPPFPPIAGLSDEAKHGHLLHADPAGDAACLRPGLHVVARHAPGLGRPHGAVGRRLLPARDGGAAEFRRPTPRSTTTAGSASPPRMSASSRSSSAALPPRSTARGGCRGATTWCTPCTNGWRRGCPRRWRRPGPEREGQVVGLLRTASQKSPAETARTSAVNHSPPA